MGQPIGKKENADANASLSVITQRVNGRREKMDGRSFGGSSVGRCAAAQRMNKVMTAYNENGTLLTDAIAVARATTPTRNVSIFQASASCRVYQARLLNACLSVEDMDNS
jgi:hypothetical protein